MSKTIKGLVALSLVALIAACSQPAEDEFVVVDPVSTDEPTTKY